MQRNKNQVRNAKSIEAISVTSVAAVCSLETRVRAAASCPSQIHYGTMSVVTSVTSKPVPSRRKRAECFEREEPRRLISPSSNGGEEEEESVHHLDREFQFLFHA